MARIARPTVLTLALSVAAALGYLAYRGIASQQVEPATVQQLDPAAGDEEAAGVALVERLPDFVLDNLAGEPQSIGSWPGQPLLINFWATWCAPCLREIPMLKTLQDEHPWLTVVGIAVDRTEPVLAFAEQMQFNYPVLVGQSEAWEAAAAFGVNFYALPFTVFTAADGSVLGVHTGELHAEQLANVVAVLEDLRGQRIDLAEARSRLAGRM
jgi:thiol-disulfide isomerase/thioredoxin